LKFKLDENLPADLAKLLRESGHDVADVFEEGLAGADDTPVLSAASAEDRVLLTFDLDFADIRYYPPGKHGGIVVFRLHDQRWQAMEGAVKRLLAMKTLEGIARGLAIVDESRVRLKRAKKGG
jgi:predicted nuclease of predicted toxin-antitoxin system